MVNISSIYYLLPVKCLAFSQDDPAYKFPHFSVCNIDGPQPSPNTGKGCYLMPYWSPKEPFNTIMPSCDIFPNNLCKVQLHHLFLFLYTQKRAIWLMAWLNISMTRGEFNSWLDKKVHFLKFLSCFSNRKNMKWLSMIKFSGHVIHRIYVIIIYTVESLSSFTCITHNLQKNMKNLPSITVKV